MKVKKPKNCDKVIYFFILMSYRFKKLLSEFYLCLVEINITNFPNRRNKAIILKNAISVVRYCHGLFKIFAFSKFAFADVVRSRICLVLPCMEISP